MEPSEVMRTNEEFVRILQAQASSDVIDANMGNDLDVLKPKYMFLAQMLASTTTQEQRADMNLRFMAMMARQQGGLSDQDVKDITGRDDL